MANAAERVALIRRGVEAWERGDVEAAISLYDPELEVYAPPEVGNSGTFHGIEAFLGWAAAWNEAWESFDQELISIEAIGETHALGRVSQTGRGRGSGIELEREATYVYEIRDGKLVYMSVFWDHNQAVALAREREGGSAPGTGEP